ncbi:hypothetical protein [Flagellimonas algicola]|uniref:Uncharacterized protein n=1 Tax=Flagellimonas algicola TaxID=2583815 RepID=A0ABY2WL29_9FLAO|nr:hypothetical protein [Allomuricauda algicola]TMU55129.1 hypothetical protein FGG15_13175 [Allomuricauda algicola]
MSGEYRIRTGGLSDVHRNATAHDQRKYLSALLMSIMLTTNPIKKAPRYEVLGGEYRIRTGGLLPASFRISILLKSKNHFICLIFNKLHRFS